MEAYKEQMNEIINFAKNNGFDLQNLSKEMLDSIMNKWIKQNMSFYKLMNEAPISVKKSLLNL